MADPTHLSDTGFAPTDRQRQDLLDWFAAYDAMAARNDLSGMADQALFPITVVTNDSAGECVSQQWDRDTFVRSQELAAAGADGEMTLDNHREPVFLNDDLAVVITNSVVTLDGQTQHMRYADVMVKSAGAWKFRCMVQAGWGDMLKEYLGA